MSGFAVPTFVSFLQDIESPYEVKEYIRVYLGKLTKQVINGWLLILLLVFVLGETKECTDFCKQFLERRSKYKNQIRAQNAHVDDMCSPAPALTPSSDFQEVKVGGLGMVFVSSNRRILSVFPFSRAKLRR